MKKSTESLPTGQVLFILGIFLCSSLIFFYLGARLGPELLKIDDKCDFTNAPILPDGKIEEEMRQILASDTHEFIFHDALQDKKQLADLEVINAAQKEAQEAIQIQEALSESKAKEKDLSDKTQKTDPQQKKPITQTAQESIVVAQSPIEPLDDELQAFVSAVYHLQLGSFAEKSKAEAALALWKKRGFDGTISSSKIEGKGLWYRLELGRYTTEQEVQAARKQIQQKYGQTTKVVKSEAM